VNPGIKAAFLCVHHCPFRHTSGIYPQYPQDTSLATTSNDELGQEDDKIALPFVEEVHWAVHYRFFLLEGASLLMLLWGCLIPIINTTFIKLSTTAYLFSLSLLVSSWDSTCCDLLARDSKSNRCQFPSPMYMNTKLPHQTTTPRKIPWTVICLCLDIVAPGIRYSRVRRNKKPHGKCGVNAALLIRKVDCWNSQQCIAVQTLAESNDVQA